MLNSRTKDKIYAFLSFLTIILVIGSFAAVAGFLLETNKYIFSVDEKIVKEKTTVMDKTGFKAIKEKLSLKKSKNAAVSQPENITSFEEKNIPEISLSPSPEFSPSSLSGISPNPSSSLTPSPSNGTAR